MHQKHKICVFTIISIRDKFWLVQWRWEPDRANVTNFLWCLSLNDSGEPEPWVEIALLLEIELLHGQRKWVKLTRMGWVIHGLSRFSAQILEKFQQREMRTSAPAFHFTVQPSFRSTFLAHGLSSGEKFQKWHCLFFQHIYCVIFWEWPIWNIKLENDRLPRGLWKSVRRFQRLRTTITNDIFDVLFVLFKRLYKQVLLANCYFDSWRLHNKMQRFSTVDLTVLKK